MTSSTAATTTSVPYETLPDGSALPITAIFDGSVVTLRGAVPDAAAAGRLEQWAKDNARDPNAVVRNELDVNPGTPINVGVRLLELQFTQFPEGGAELQPEHEADLSRVVSMLNERPTISVVVVGHADQPGADAFNVVAAERARRVHSHLAAAGIAPTRLSSRGAGLDDFRTLDDTILAALGGRVEFVFRGLLIP
ncbi:MAG: OmpA family protein [Ilumatobacteraceae bacterium]